MSIKSKLESQVFKYNTGCIMNIFISWSGDLSHNTALVLKKWIPKVINNLTIYVSSEDIDKGKRWFNEISEKLESSNFGILCLTKANIQKPWIYFEAGALSKIIGVSNVCPFLVGIERSEIKAGEPLYAFQSTIFEKDDVLKLMISINNAKDSQKSREKSIRKRFDEYWPNFENDLNLLLEEYKKESSICDAYPSNFYTNDFYPYVRKLYSIERYLSFDPENLALNMNSTMDLAICSNISNLKYVKHSTGIAENSGLKFTNFKIHLIEDSLERSTGEIRLEKTLDLRDSATSKRWRVVFNPRLKKSEEAKYKMQYSYSGTRFISFEEFLDAKKNSRLPSDKEFESVNPSSPVPCKKLISTIQFPVGYHIQDPNFSVKKGGHEIEKEIERINSNNFF